MKKILGLDLGTNSIGWAFLNEPDNDKEKYSIVKIGSRIVPLSPDENDEFTKGNAISKNAGRTLMRGARRTMQRYKLRKTLLNKFFKELNINIPEHLFKLTSTLLYELHHKGATEQITLEEFARLLYHFNQKRGYKSNRKANNEEEIGDVKNKKDNDAEDEPKKEVKKGYLDAITDREQLLKEKNITIGQYFYEQLKTNPFYRIKENIFMRSSYVAEFQKIWDTQKKYYPSVLTDENLKKVRDEIIYYHRPLKSQKALVSECRFEKHHKVAPKSSPLFQINKIWQEINNIKINDKSGNEIKLSLEQKTKLFNELNKVEKLSTSRLFALLEMGKQENYYVNIKKDLEGNRTYALLNKRLKGADTESILKFELVYDSIDKVDTNTGEIFKTLNINPSFINEPLYRLWHLIYSVEENETLLKNLIEDFNFTEAQAKELCKIDFHKSGYGNLSARATRKILPYLQQGLQYNVACENAGYRHSDYLTKTENKERELKLKLELYKKNSLRNPVVEKIINQVINLVNAIIEDPELGRPDEIRVELGRELKQNAEERKNTYTRNGKQDKAHKAIADILYKELGFKRVSRGDIEKYKLWQEFGQQSPYEPGKVIGLTELFKGDYEVEHIIPRSRLFDDSFTNKTIAPRRINAAKDNSTAHDYMKSLGDETFNNYTEFIKKNYFKKDGISKGKLDKLLMAGDKIPEDFISRQLRETQYISKEIKNLLSQICRNVYATSGSVTDYLKHNWGVDDALKNLNIGKYPEDQIEIIEHKDGSKTKRIKNWTKRDDHRHHAIDALIIACTKQKYIQQLNALNQNHKTQKELKESGRKFDAPWDGFVNSIEKATDNVLISFKAGKRVATLNRNKIKKGKGETKQVVMQETLTPRGFLHKDTVYGEVKQYIKVKLSPKFDKFNEIADASIRQELLELLAKHENDPKKAFKESEKNPIPEHLKEITLYQHEHVVKYPLGDSFKAADAEFIVDRKVREVVKKRLSDFNNNHKEAFKDLDKNPIWMNKEKGVFIKSVRCFTGLSDLQPLHKNEKGEKIDFVSTRNNHHIAIYKDENGKLQENTVTFWDALERKKAKLPVVIKNPKEVWDKVLENQDRFNQGLIDNLPNDKWEFVTSLQQNEMFVFGLTRDELESAVKENNNSLISKHLYRVQKLATKNYFFRNHLETSIDDKKNGGESISKQLKKLIIVSSLEKMTGFKVKINSLGKIVKICE